MQLQSFVGRIRSRVGRSLRHILRTDALAQQLEALQIEQLNTLNSLSQVGQLNLAQRYAALKARGQRLPSLEAAEFRVYSQNGEDGILHYLFAMLGVTNKRCVEMCAGNGRDCNTANLIVNAGWQGLLFDGDPALVAQARSFYASLRDTAVWPPQCVDAWITAENVNDLIQAQGVTGEIDLLSLDLDGVDWWIWRALEIVRPRVVVAEYQDCWPAEIAVTVPYRADFVATRDEHGVPAYAGASLAAFVRLAERKGYRYVGSERLGFNAFFVQHGLGEDLAPAAPIAQGLKHPAHFENAIRRRPLVEQLEWVDVDSVP